MRGRALSTRRTQNKTLYIRSEDKAVWDDAWNRAWANGQSLSTYVAQALQEKNNNEIKDRR